MEAYLHTCKVYLTYGPPVVVYPLRVNVQYQMYDTAARLKLGKERPYMILIDFPCVGFT